MKMNEPKPQPYGHFFQVHRKHLPRIDEAE